MQNESTVSRPAASNIINIADYGSRRKAGTEKWLEERIRSEYGEADEATLHNPLIRIMTKFEALDQLSQIQLFGFAESRILGLNGSLDLQERLEAVLKAKRPQVNQRVAWMDIESEADELLGKLRNGGMV